MINRQDIAQLVPHHGAMCLWDEVVAWHDTEVKVRSCRHTRLDHPLRHQGRLHAVQLCEYGAQAAAVHGGLLMQQNPTTGVAGRLVALRQVTLNVEWLDDFFGPLEGRAERIAASAESQLYAFWLTHAGTVLAQGRATIVRDDHRIVIE